MILKKAIIGIEYCTTRIILTDFRDRNEIELKIGDIKDIF